MYILWGDSTSSRFRVSNGVKQGGILSPRLFNVYMDDLSKELSFSRIGVNVGGNLSNHLCYADDFTLISLCSAGMEKLLVTCNCNMYGIEYEHVYNSLKSNVMSFKLKEINLKRYPVFEFAGGNIKFVT